MTQHRKELEAHLAARTNVDSMMAGDTSGTIAVACDAACPLQHEQHSGLSFALVLAFVLVLGVGMGLLTRIRSK